MKKDKSYTRELLFSRYLNNWLGFVFYSANKMSIIESIIHLATSWALFTLIWITQLITYPGFKFVDQVQFPNFHLQYTTAITIIVMPLMLIELGFCGWLVVKSQLYWVHMLSLIMVGLIWGSTFFIQVPLHNQLGQGYDLTAIQKLVSTNWIRTVLWSVKAIWVTYLIYQVSK